MNLSYILVTVIIVYSRKKSLKIP